jgi:thioredoxin reductase (NADPH)
MCVGETVYVVGGGNSAGQAAMHLSAYATEVVMLVRGERLADTLSDYLLRKIEQAPRVRVVTHCEVVALEGGHSLEGITVRQRGSGVETRLPTRHVFVCIGGLPNTEWARDTAIVRDDAGYLVTGADLGPAGTPPPGWPLARAPFPLETSVPGSLRRGRRAPWLHQAGGLGRGRRRHGRGLHSPTPCQHLRTSP